MDKWRKIDLSSLKVSVGEEERIREECKRKLGKAVEKKSKIANVKKWLLDMLKTRTKTNEPYYLKTDYLDEQVNEMNQWFKDVFCKTDWNEFIK